MTKWAVAVQKIATAHCGCTINGHGGRELVEAAASERSLKYVSSLDRGREQAVQR